MSSLSKTEFDDRLEIVSNGDYKVINVRTTTVIMDDDKEVSRTFHRRVIAPGFLDESDNLVETDLSSESLEIQGICEVIWSQSVKDAWRSNLISEKFPNRYK